VRFQSQRSPTTYSRTVRTYVRTTNVRTYFASKPTIMRAANVPGLNKRTPIANRTSQNRPGQPSSRFPLSTRSDRSFLIWGPPKPAAPTQTWPNRTLRVFAKLPVVPFFFSSVSPRNPVCSYYGDRQNRRHPHKPGLTAPCAFSQNCPSYLFFFVCQPQKPCLLI